MAQIIRGTTPTIEFTFKVVDVTSINTAVMTIKQGGQIVVEKDKSTATIGDDSLSWTLSQEDSLSLGCGLVRVMLNWVLADGTRGASDNNGVEMLPNHKNEVIA